MSAAELRKAAETLRERAGRATPGPWVVASEFGPDRGRMYVVPADEHLSTYVSAGGGPDYDEDADYIATMHPGVGLALADALTQASDLIDANGFHTNGPLDDVARLINGGAA